MVTGAVEDDAEGTPATSAATEVVAVAAVLETEATVATGMVVTTEAAAAGVEAVVVLVVVATVVVVDLMVGKALSALKYSDAIGGPKRVAFPRI